MHDTSHSPIRSRAVLIVPSFVSNSSQATPQSISSTTHDTSVSTTTPLSYHGDTTMMDPAGAPYPTNVFSMPTGDDVSRIALAAQLNSNDNFASACHSSPADDHSLADDRVATTVGSSKPQATNTHTMVTHSKGCS
ncbi:hypothetical protein V6N13_097847 [Hibiscus sabdariffa]